MEKFCQKRIFFNIPWKREGFQENFKLPLHPLNYEWCLLHVYRSKNDSKIKKNRICSCRGPYSPGGGNGGSAAAVAAAAAAAAVGGEWSGEVF
jgi:hypothetical protein